jgi:hypothetical protein
MFPFTDNTELMMSPFTDNTELMFCVLNECKQLQKKFQF